MSRIALWRDRLAYQPLLLGVVALLTAAALALGNQMTKESIHAAEQRDLLASLSQVLPEGSADNDLIQDTIEIEGKKVYRARRGGAPTGAVFQVASRGYAADIVVLMAVGMDGRMLGARVIKHVETPGLGDKIEIAKGKWILDFNGKSLGDPPPEKWAVKKDGGIFDQFAGATITPRAVVKAVKGGLEFFAAHESEIFGGRP